jgi:endonuclease/exonuclease/phosphatase family metal-dependent hydrolase
MRIATFNLENLDDTERAVAPLEARARLLRPQLARLEADILCLQEVHAQHTADEPRGPRAFRALDALLDGTAYAGFHRTHTTLADRRGPLDVHNLLILSRWPIAAAHQLWHDLVAAPAWRSATAIPPQAEAAKLQWDRPVLYAEIAAPGGRRLLVFNLHLRAPLAAYVPGQKAGPFAWKSVPGWAEGFFVAAVKRSGQALEARMAVDAVFDADAEALIAVCGDMNTEEREMPLRILRGDAEDTGSGALAGRALVPLERTAPEARRYSVLHGGRSSMLDHVLVSRPLLRFFQHVEIHNEALGDELVGYANVEASPESYHAPVVAAFGL